MPGIQEVLNKLDELEAKMGEVEVAVNADRIVYATCAHCNAIGMENPDPSNCTVCGGSGFRPSGKTGKV